MPNIGLLLVLINKIFIALQITKSQQKTKGPKLKTMTLENTLWTLAVFLDKKLNFFGLFV